MATKQANAICIKWGTAYGPEYSNRLYSGVRTNLSVPVRFFCVTEIREGLHPDIEAIDLPDEPWLEEMNAALAKLDRYWEMRKASLFRPGLIPDLDGPLLGFDLDVVVTGSLDPLLEFEPGKVIMRHDWFKERNGRDGGHGSVFRFDPRRHGWLYDTLAADPTGEVEKVGGEEQLYTSSVAQRHGSFAYIPSDWIASFKFDCRRKPPANLFRQPRLPRNARVICFHGRPKNQEAMDGYHKRPWTSRRRSLPCAWIKEHWIDRTAADLGADWS